MKKLSITLISLLIIVSVFSGCTKSEFAKDYKDPSKVNEAQIGQIYTGALQSILKYVMPTYGRYFVIEQPWIAPFTQSIGLVQHSGMYKVGTGAADERWADYYTFLAQYREFQKVYQSLPDNKQEENRVYYITATIFMYDQTEKMVDLYGDIPWSEAGYVAEYGNDYLKARAKFDPASEIYTTMLDSLKIFADELATLTVPTSVQLTFRNQDFINLGDLDLWKRYCNSLRLRMLTRLSDLSPFKQRYDSEIGSIVTNLQKYPIVLTNEDNIQVDVINQSGAIKSDGWDQGIGSDGWNLDIASKTMMDFMNDNNDPRRRVLFEKNVDGIYQGLDGFLASSKADDLINDGKISIYNRTTFDGNDYYPGVLITASEVNFILAEYYLRKNGIDDANAEKYYNNGIKESIVFHFNTQKLSQNTSLAGVADPIKPSEISAYLDESNVKWDNASSDRDALSLIANQRWVHFNIVQNTQNWCSQRRLDLPELTFPIDHSGTQPTPPVRFPYSSSEISFNNENYQKVADQDNLNTKIFWDVN